MPRQGYLDGKQDLNDYSNWIYEQTDDWRNVNSGVFRDELSEFEIDEALNEARNLMINIMEEYEAQGLPEDVHLVIPPHTIADPFQRFMACVKEDRQDSYSWHMWATSNQKLWISQSEVEQLGLPVDMVGRPIGYSEKLLTTTLLRNTALMQHIYEEIPSSITWNLNKIIQDGKTVYMGAAPTSEIDAVSKVPWIPPSLQSHEFANQAHNGSLSSNDKWQRLVSLSRLEKIRNFARDSSNFMFNPVLLYVNENHKSIKFDKKSKKITIKFDFLKEKTGLFYDYISWPNEEDNRPIWVVDGQHRVRGLGGSTRGSLLSLPFVIMLGDGSEEDRELVARIFTEINTNAKSLDSMHQLYLKWQFAIPADASQDDFRRIEGIPTDKSRPNRRAFDLALYMASDTDSPMYNAIQFQEPDKSSAPRSRMSRNLIVKSTNWSSLARKWFTQNNIYSQESTDSFNFEEIMNFFKAFRDTCNHDGWVDGENRWRNDNERKIKRSIIQQQGPFRALMDLIPFSINRAELLFGNVERPFTVEHFKRILSPLSNIDWNLDTNEENGLKSLKGRGNLNVPHLKMWMKRAIENAEIFSWEEIHNPNLRSLPGRGLNARPSDENLEITLEADSEPWPGVLPMQVSIPRPEHALKGWWSIIQGVDGKQRAIEHKKAWIFEDGEKSMLNVAKEHIHPDAEWIKINAGWKNGIDEVYAHQTMNLQAP
jgi:DGQHR domain-containing protein